MEKSICIENINRFNGVSGIYDKNRPTPPEEIIKILKSYLGREVELVVDLGSGTGLSSRIWWNHAKNIIGVEPNNEMREEATKKTENENICFIEGVSNKVDLHDEVCDIVTCSQSFHWMEPKSTINEVARLLKNGGIFAAYDCDWPPTVNHKVEMEFLKLRKKAEEVLNSKDEKKAKKWRKSEHLKDIKESGYFIFSKEICVHSKEVCSAERFINLTLSLGGVQSAILRYEDEIKDDVIKFKEVIMEEFGEEKE
ncbi:MAG: class I SAM-dependent methyltransferase, partial [Clostridium sp.]